MLPIPKLLNNEYTTLFLQMYGIFRQYNILSSIYHLLLQIMSEQN